jgi:pimeloyl-ACP methyl ester carboxylesterase
MRRPQQGEVRYLLEGTFYRMAYYEFGSPHSPPLLCVHGLTRTGRDFDVLATALSDQFRVICPDLPGRGNSDWLPDASLYLPPAYVTALSHLMARFDGPVPYIGTSLGGICGLAIGASLGHPISRLVLNDVGPMIPAAALRRIRSYMTMTRPEFPSLLALENHLRDIHASFGKLSDRQWEHLALVSSRPLDDGRVALHYDPGIAQPIRNAYMVDLDMWGWWDRLKIPVMAIRGAESDLLLPPTLERMVKAGAHALVVPDAGHAPALMDAPTIEAIRAFLTAKLV